jgi:hypothetical protein
MILPSLDFSDELNAKYHRDFRGLRLDARQEKLLETVECLRLADEK